MDDLLGLIEAELFPGCDHPIFPDHVKTALQGYNPADLFVTIDDRFIYLFRKCTS
jgi:hypothetical protein